MNNRIRQHPVMEIGKRIRDARSRLSLTQGQLAKIIGAEQSTVSGWETDDTRRPSRATIPRLAKALKVSAHYLEFGGDGIADRGRDYDHGGDDLNAETLDASLLTECVRMAMRSLIAPYGVDISAQKYEDAADAAITSYLTYQRLKDEKSSAA